MYIRQNYKLKKYFELKLLFYIIKHANMNVKSSFWPKNLPLWFTIFFVKLKRTQKRVKSLVFTVLISSLLFSVALKTSLETFWILRFNKKKSLGKDVHRGEIQTVTIPQVARQGSLDWVIFCFVLDYLRRCENGIRTFFSFFYKSARRKWNVFFRFFMTESVLFISKGWLGSTSLFFLYI